MSITVDQAVTELNNQQLADPHTHLKAKGREEVIAEIDRYKSQGLRAHVIVVDPGDVFTELLGAFDELNLNPSTDLLLVFNTRDFAARGWGLSADEITAALPAASKAIFSKQIIAAIDRLAAKAKKATAVAKAEADSFPVLPVVGGIAGTVTIGLVALAIRRRNKLAAEGEVARKTAIASAEKAYADVILACEDLGGTKEASDTQLRAAELKKRLDAVEGFDRIALGKITQLENELNALRSTVLQMERKQ